MLGENEHPYSPPSLINVMGLETIPDVLSKSNSCDGVGPLLNVESSG